MNDLSKNTLQMKTHSHICENGNSQLSKEILTVLIKTGILEFCLCPGARNAPLIYPLVHCPKVSLYHWPEERSAAFFALGRIKATHHAIAVITTSGTAVAELFPAVMEAYYTGLPLVLITADRPKRFRGTGAPQSCEQAHLFGHYAFSQDLTSGDVCDISSWNRAMPLHLNLCFEEPCDLESSSIRCDAIGEIEPFQISIPFTPDHRFPLFLKKIHYPLVIVGHLPSTLREEAIRFLLHLKAPIYAEGVSGIREEPQLQHLVIKQTKNLWKNAHKYGYPIDSVLRLGGIPTARIWRDLEHKQGEIEVCSISEQPFSGLSFVDVIHTSLKPFLNWAISLKNPSFPSFEEWKQHNERIHQQLITLYQKYPKAEESLIHRLSCIIPQNAKVYLGNSLPIREWDASATYENKKFQLNCNRGLNGIDGQLSTFLGWSSPETSNFALLGDLTFLYDLIAPWILNQLKDTLVNLIVINNGGGKIFKQMFSHSAFQNKHHLNFEPQAHFWGLEYHKLQCIPETFPGIHNKHSRLIELIPSEEETDQFLAEKQFLL